MAIGSWRLHWRHILIHNNAQVRRIRIATAFDGVPRKEVGDKLRDFLRGRVVRRNREEADIARTRDEDGLVVWADGQIGGTTR